MHPRAIDRFFKTLAGEFGGTATLIVTGAAAGSLWGRIRPSQDIDFGVQLASRGRATWDRFQTAVQHAIERTGIQVNYAEDIDRWGSVTLLDYRRHTTLYRRFGTLTVRLLDPAYWAIGKLGRYFALDVDDLVQVLTRRRMPAAAAVRIWGRALRESPRSTALTQFRAQVEHFLRTYGRTIWGRGFDADAAVRQFHLAAGLPLARHSKERA